MDDFVMTLDLQEDAAAEEVSSEAEEEVLMAGAVSKSGKAQRKKNRKRSKGKKQAAAATPAAFRFDEEEQDAVVSPWDFKKVRKEQEAHSSSLSTSVMHKVQKQLERKAATHGSDSESDQDSESEEERETDSDDEDEASSDEEKGGQGKPTKPATPSKPMPRPTVADFSELHLSRPLLRATKDMGFVRPTPVQAHAIPVALGGSDVLVNAVTGSGKTAAFLLPVLERLLYRPRRVPMTRVLIISPTRELAAQCQSMAQHLGKHTDVRVALVVGGLSMNVQEVALRGRPDIVVATPGRLIDHLRNSRTVHLEDIEILILDEADRLLEKGFVAEVREIIKSCPRGRQTMLFSATLTDEVADLAKLSLNKPRRICIDAMNSIVRGLTQEFIRVRPAHMKSREGMLLALCKRTFRSQTIVFFRSKQAAHRTMIIFGLCGLKASELHGNLTQTQRLEALDLFREGAVDFLLCTDLAARGLDIKGVQTVINFEVPNTLQQYIHRVGRTARAGASGRSVTILPDSQRKLLKKVMQHSQNDAASGSCIKSRSIPPKVVRKYCAKIDSLADDIAAVLAEERVEKEVRLAEMEANKARNLHLHRQDIAARPARTWFQTPKEKKAAKLAGLLSHTNFDPDTVAKLQGTEEERKQAQAEKEQKEIKKRKKDPLRGLKRRDKRKKMMRMMIEEEKRARARQLSSGQSSQEVAFTAQQRMAKAARVEKSKRRGGVQDHKHTDLVDAGTLESTVRVGGGGKKKKRKSHRRFATEESANQFDQRYSKIVDRVFEREADIAKQAKQANKPKSARGSFKSKKRYKRR